MSSTSFLTAGTVGKAALATIVGLAAYYNDRAVFDENRKGIANEPGYPLIGNLPMLIQAKDSIHDLMLEVYHQRQQMTITFSILGVPRQILTLDPQNVEHILKSPEFHSSLNDLFGNGIFNANGEEWKFQRKTASIIFNVKNFRDQFTDVFLDELRVMKSDILDKAVAENQVIDFHDLMFKFTLDSFILLGFGVHLNSLKTEGKVPFAESFDAAQRATFQRFINPVWPVTEKLQKLVNPWTKDMNYHLKVVDEYARGVTEKRRKELAEGQVHKDLLSRFMEASNIHGEPLSNTELRDIVLNFVIAGRDTTAQALSWCFYLLSQHPRVQEKLLKEINDFVTDDLLEDSARLYESIKEMKYTHAIFYEVLRLYPSVPLNQKYALKDDVLPDGTPIRKGDYVIWCPYAQGRVEAIWGADAKQFVPERWINENGELRRESQGKWPAFNAGPRVCLGQNLATLEAIVAIIFLVREYKFSLAPGQNITYDVSLTLPMKYGMKMHVERR
ncbi:cytochrome P450 [Hesseltinella vesiculosa]|uniref:Cytochrome P450 n=1 Tax=Hesseltinella vesiculosa TaxID=101127 RepID=A0A1X2GN21_9FUNG|nr:cytochrome P450 [Hesseltinella vesiculosa]